MKLVVKLRIYAFEPIPAAAEEPVFSCGGPRRRPRTSALLISIALHVLVIGLSTVISNYFHEDDVGWSRYRVVPLSIHLSTPLYFDFSAGADNRVASAAPPARRATQPLQPATGAQAPAGKANGSFGLQLPMSSQMVKDAPVIIQPEPRIQAPRPVQPMPSLAFWARQAIDLPKPPPPKETVSPGRTEAPSASPRLGAPSPVAAVPNREEVVKDINVSLPQKEAQIASPLPIPNSATMPVRLRDVPEPQTASFDPFLGQAANILVMGAERQDVRDIEIPRGLQNIPRLAGFDAGTAGSGETTSSSGKPGRDSTESNRGSRAVGANQTETTGTYGLVPGKSTGSGSAPTVNASAAPSAGIGEVSAAKTGIPTNSSVVSRLVSPPEVLHIQHPLNGSFDVVIMQSAVRSDLPQTNNMLSGSPVYSVYLRVGDTKEWLLEYCTPATKAVQPNSYQLNIGDAGPVTPPYPVATAIPKYVLSEQIPKHIVLHGFLTSAGHFREVKAPDPNNPITAQILALLSEWQFRPALLNKSPIEIEILLVIPPRS